MRVSNLLLIALVLPIAAEAKTIAYQNAPCVEGIRKNASISVSFDGEESSLAAARSAFDAQKKAVDAEAKKLGGEQLQAENYSYQISMDTRYNNSTQTIAYRFSGSTNYKISSEAVAQKLCDKLAEMKRRFSMSVDANSCQDEKASPLGGRRVE